MKESPRTPVGEWYEEELTYVGENLEPGMRGTSSDMFESSADQTVTFGGPGGSRTPGERPRETGARPRPLFLGTPTQQASDNTSGTRPLSSTLMSETLTSTTMVEMRETRTESSQHSVVNSPAMRCPDPELHREPQSCQPTHVHHHHLPAVILQSPQCGIGMPAMVTCGIQAHNPVSICAGQAEQQKEKRGKGPGGSHLPWQKLSRKPTLRIESTRPERAARVEANMRRLGLEKLWPGKRTLEPRQKKGKESVEEKLERKVGLLKKPWERLEIGGQAPPSSSEDESLGHEHPAIFTRSLFDLSPGHLADSDSEEDKDDAVEEGQAKRAKF